MRQPRLIRPAFTEAVNRLAATLLKKRWVLFEFPTNALAQDAEMSLEEFENFVYSASIKDWNKESKKQDKLKKVIDKEDQRRLLNAIGEVQIVLDISAERYREKIKVRHQVKRPDALFA